MHSLWHDLRYALRNLRKSPGFALVAILTLALGIGASTAIFSVLENILIEPFPYPDAQRFMSIQIHDTEQNGSGGRGGFIGPEFLDYVTQNHVFDRVIANDQSDVLYRSSAGTQLLKGSYVTPGTFEFLAMPALLGRVMQPADYEPAAPPVFVLRYKTWVNEFVADPAILNKTFVLNGTPRTLVGIMPPRFGWGDADVWIPEKPSRTEVAAAASPNQRFWFFMGHLKPGVTTKQAEADLNVIAKSLSAIYPKYYPKHFSVRVQSLTDLVVGDFRTTLYIVFAAVGLLLLIGCGNVANLLLARATTREKEFAVRSALGASRYRLVRQLLVESLILALGGAAMGTLLAWAGLKSLVALMPQGIVPAEAQIRLNAPVLLFALSVSVLTALVFGLLPAMKASRTDLNDPLRDVGKGLSGGFRHAKLRSAVVILEVALSLTLLVAAGLLMRSFVALREVRLGFRSDHVLVARLPLPVERYKTATQISGFYRPLLQRLKTLPGVVDATETSTLPPYGGIGSDIEIPGGKSHPDKWQSIFQLCSEGYFNVLRLQFLDGRPFTEAEVDGARKLAVVNQTFVKKYLQGENPLGREVRIMQLADFEDKVSDPVFQIIGVVADAKNRGLQDPPEAEIWIPFTVTGSALRGILVRTTQDPLAMLNSVRQEVWATDSNVALTLTGSMDDFISQFSYAGPRFGSILMMIFGSVGLVLVTIGVYSVLSYTTARRTQEIGIRMALGANGSDVLTMVVTMGLQLVAIGVIVGILVSVALGRIISTQLWGVSAYDPITLISVPVLLLLTGLLACYVPARRASQLDPMTALRYE